jgi:hypothetical protein
LNFDALVSKKIKKGFSYQNDITKIAENFEAFVLIMKIHLIAIGGAAMHNMAIALSQKGFIVSGSDDEINEPSASRLKKCWPIARSNWVVSRKNYPSIRCCNFGHACKGR